MLDCCRGIPHLEQKSHEACLDKFGQTSELYWKSISHCSEIESGFMLDISIANSSTSKQNQNLRIVQHFFLKNNSIREPAYNKYTV